jgi:hypothetical protein
MPSGQSQRTTLSLRPHGSVTSALKWDATKSNAPAELLQRGFELAYCLIPDRVTAVDTLTRALEKIRARSRREMKRLYWRDKHSQRPVRRIARSDADMLQWLIMFESEQNEKAQEGAGTVSLNSMVVRYIKHLVQITTALSSFYVNVGLSRLLHSYSTPEAQRVYETLTSRFLGADEYRRAKSALMEKINHRFSGLVKLVRVEHGELRFETAHDQEQWGKVVAHSLSAFTPWSTQGRCAEFTTVNGGSSKPTTTYKSSHRDQNEVEMECCHILIEPSCYGRLMKELGFDSPDTKLALPRFVMPEKHDQSDDNTNQSTHPSGLCQEDLDHIERRLAATDARRRHINPRAVTIAIDGVEHTRLDLSQRAQVEIGLEAGASIIEIRGEDDRGELLLATHLISYANDAFESTRAAATLRSGKLKFAVTPIATQGLGPPRAILILNYQPKFQLARPSLAWQRIKASGKTVRAYALAALVTGVVGWAVAGAFYSHKIRVLEQQLQQAHGNPQQVLPTAARAILSYRLTSDDQTVRGGGTSGVPEISLQPHPSAISLELPLRKAAARTESYSAELKTFAGDRTLITQNFLPATTTDSGPVIELVVPADLLKVGTHYTVLLHSSDRTDHFTFKVVNGQ